MDALETGLLAFSRSAWAEAFEQLSRADLTGDLATEELECLGAAAYLSGHEDVSTELLPRVYHQHLEHGDRPRAARCAFWLAFSLLSRGEDGPGHGWLSRARQVIQDEPECAEHGYVLVPEAVELLYSGQPQQAYDMFDAAGVIGRRSDEPDLIAFADHGRGHALVMLGDVVGGMALFDEVMVAITSGEVSSMAGGIMYCAVIERCHDIGDLRRAHEWTTALSRFVDAQPELVPYRGQCLIHRAQIMQLHGAWPDALEEVGQAVERLSLPPPHPAVGFAYYQQGEILRLRGEFQAAEEAYRSANRWGHLPQPGLALLRLSEGQPGPAVAALHNALDGLPKAMGRCQLLAAYVQLTLSAGDLDTASDAAQELETAAADSDAPMLHALSAQANGEVSLQRGDARAALAELRWAWRVWHELDAPYEAARARVLIARACRSLKDEDTTLMELDAARSAFQQLGAAPDLQRVEDLMTPAKALASTGRGPLTAREVEVLRLVASGRTNRAIASELFLSEKTVARHLSNIFTKLDLTSRSAATAYAYESGLVERMR